MKVPLNWLKEFVEIDVSPEELAEKLTLAGLEVEKVNYQGRGLENVIVAQIESIWPHPNADKLTLCDVNTGTDTVQVVCGAKNMKAGDRVALALPGAVLADGMKLKKTKIRGETSYGMMCSEIELNLGENASGIIILPKDYSLGGDLSAAMGLEDAVFEIEITPNRPDCLSILGIAREVGAILGNKVRIPQIDFAEEGKKCEEWTSITIENYELCPRYAGRIITDIKVGPSPSWMKQRLEKCGIRSINNVVDVTNYVLLELGHPLHAFDYEKLAGHRIVVRTARPGEKIFSLDGEERKLSEDMLVIADAEKPVAIAGVMGGANSEVSEETKTVLLESAYFNQASIRRTSKKLGLSTEASYRFERGADPGVQVTTADRVCRLLIEVAGGKVAKGVLDVKQAEPARRNIRLRVKRINDILGTEIPEADVREILSRLELEVDSAGEGVLDVEAPTFRVDLAREIDLVEEVGRIYGYQNIPTPDSNCRLGTVELNLIHRFESVTKNILTGLGLYEIICCNLIGKTSLEEIGDKFFEYDRLLTVLSSKSGEKTILRPTLLPGILECVARNLHQNQRDIKIFELGRVHFGGGNDSPVEKLMLSLAMTGGRTPKSWDTGYKEIDFFDLKGVIEEYLKRLNIYGAEFREESNPFFRGGQGASVLLEGRRIGLLGEAGPQVRERFEIKSRVFIAELDTEPLVPWVEKSPCFEQLSVFPSTSRDVAIIVDDGVSYSQIRSALEQMRKGIVSEIALFDFYRGEQVSSGKKSLAFSITYRSADRTLTDEEVEKAHSKIKKSLIRELQCEIRE